MCDTVLVLVTSQGMTFGYSLPKLTFEISFLSHTDGRQHDGITTCVVKPRVLDNISLHCKLQYGNAAINYVCTHR
jgi:hypothetical protein